MRKRWYILAAAASVVLAAAACSSGSSGDLESGLETLAGSEDESGSLEARENQEETETDRQEPSTAEPQGEKSVQEGILNNGGSVVRFQGNDYYWRYSEDSVEKEGLFARYYVKEETPNQMVCRRPDGTEEVLFEMAGSKEIFMAGGRLYLSSDTESYSVNLDGGDRKDYGYMRWLAAEDGGSGVVGYDGQKIYRIDGESGSQEELAGSPGDTYHYYFPGIAGNCLYFSFCDTQDQCLVLCQYKLDGSGELVEADRFSLPEDLRDVAGNAIVTQVSRLGDTLFYSYGCYGGTGGFFQSGGINYVRLDGNGEPAESGVSVFPITAEEFVAEERDGAVRLYFIQDETGSYVGYEQDGAYPGCTVMNLQTGETEASDFPLSRPKAVVNIEGAICMEGENQAAYTTLIPRSLAQAYGCDNEDMEQQATMIIDVEVIGDQVYYTVEKSSRYQEGDVGWRPCYRRESSDRYKMTVGGEDASLLFSY